MNLKYKLLTLFLGIMCSPLVSFAAEEENIPHIDSTNTFLGITCIALFILAYVFVILEEFIHLKKSKPVILTAGLIWVIIGIIVAQKGIDPDFLKAYIKHTLAEYAELFFFLLVAMTYINAMTNRLVFESLRCYLIKKNFSFYKLYWITGIASFFISAVADNLTTALIFGAVVLSVGSGNKKFISISFISIVVAANAGGAFSPFGDITTLMVWQKGNVQFFEFFKLFIPAVVNYLVPAIILSFFIPKESPKVDTATVPLRRGAKRICLFFLISIILSVSFEQFLHIPPFMGMMTGLAILMLFGYYLIKNTRGRDKGFEFNIFNNIAQAEWDTLMFFFGVIFCVGGLDFLGYLHLTSHYAYDGFGHTNANIAAGAISSIVDNIPVMFAILSMDPHMDHFQWLLVTLTAGTGGSLLSVGSAAGVALMGQSKGQYTFFSHLKWSWAVGLGYTASIYVHYLINA